MVPTSAVLGRAGRGGRRRHPVGGPADLRLRRGRGGRARSSSGRWSSWPAAAGLTILGPNGNGYINAAAGITPYGLPIDNPLLRGPVGVVLQSGALASAVLTLRAVPQRRRQPAGVDGQRVDGVDDRRHALPHRRRRHPGHRAVHRVAAPPGRVPRPRPRGPGQGQAGRRDQGRPQPGRRPGRQGAHRLPGRRRRRGRRGVPAERRHPGRQPGGPHHHRRAAGRDRAAAGQPLRVRHRVRRRQRDHRRPGRGRGHRDPRVRPGDGGAAAPGAARRSPRPRTRSTSPATSWSTGTCCATPSRPCTTTPAWTRWCWSPTCRGRRRPTPRPIIDMLPADRRAAARAAPSRSS